jgi:hypothetical protein
LIDFNQHNKRYCKYLKKFTKENIDTHIDVDY